MYISSEYGRLSSAYIYSLRGRNNIGSKNVVKGNASAEAICGENIEGEAVEGTNSDKQSETCFCSILRSKLLMQQTAAMPYYGSKNYLGYSNLYGSNNYLGYGNLYGINNYMGYSGLLSQILESM